jgi:hypothetical protein
MIFSFKNLLIQSCRLHHLEWVNLSSTSGVPLVVVGLPSLGLKGSAFSVFL